MGRFRGVCVGEGPLPLMPCTEGPLPLMPFTEVPLPLMPFTEVPLPLMPFTEVPLPLMPFTEVPLPLMPFTVAPLPLMPLTNKRPPLTGCVPETATWLPTVGDSMPYDMRGVRSTVTPLITTRPREGSAPCTVPKR